MATTKAAAAGCTIGALVCVAIATPAVAADDFCTVLKSVVAAAPEGFAGIRGEPDLEYPASYWRPLALPGAQPLMLGGSPCFVLHGAKVNPSDQYHCDYPGGTDSATLLESTRGLAEKISACLSPTSSTEAGGVWSLAVSGASIVVASDETSAGGGGIAEIIIEPAR